jgi:4'-phosphopantetheinyl transferase
MNKVLQYRPFVRTIATGYPFREIMSAKTTGPEGNEIHLWTVPCSDLDRDDLTLSAVISRDEHHKASLFKKTADARDYMLRHGYLRLVLGHYFCSDPALIPLVIADQGKPGLEIRPGFSPLFFSLSRTREMVALAVTRQSDIGIDMVKPDERFPFIETAAFLFTPGERALVSGVQPDLQCRQFFRIWALKEAVLKATGGTAMMMRGTDVSAVVRGIARDGRYPIRYQHGEHAFFIHESAVGNGHYCAIAVRLTT